MKKIGGKGKKLQHFKFCQLQQLKLSTPGKFQIIGRFFKLKTKIYRDGQEKRST